MKIKFLSFLGVCLWVMGVDFSAFAGCSSSEAGEYCLTKKKYTCPPGCYCEKATKNGALDTDGNKKTDISDTAVTLWCFVGVSCAWADGDGQCGTSNNAKIYRCPKGWTTRQGATSINECFKNCSDQTLNYKEIQCEAGKYLQKGQTTCTSCRSINPNVDDKTICPGMTSPVAPSCTDVQGTETCGYGEKANADRTACLKEAQKYTCIAGEYLPKNSTKCAECPEGFVCEETKDYEEKAIDQGKHLPKNVCNENQKVNYNRSGCEKCPDGYLANEERTECSVAQTITVSAGKYLPANSVTPTNCPTDNAKKYCPGGEFTKQNKNQGYVDCPLNGRSTDRKTCSVTLTKDQMKYGPNGKDTPTASQCWSQTDYPDKYQACVFGIKLQED